MKKKASGPIVAHWTLTNSSGMHRVAETLAEAEVKLGLDSKVVSLDDQPSWDAAMTADVHVVHTHFPTKMNKARKKGSKTVWVGHGTPDHVFQNAAESAQNGGYGHSDDVMLMQHWLKMADAKVTFWERHKWIYDSMLPVAARKTDLIPLGVDRAFWGAGVTRGKYAGEPSVFTAENPHYIKWPYDLVTAWPAVLEQVTEARLHMIYLPRDMHRTFIPWMNANGASFGSYISPSVFTKEELRNAFQSTDYTIGLVRYGDLNHLSLQANAAGSKTISYTGNPHAAYWIPEGDQREIAKHLIAILKGDVMPRKSTEVPDISDTARAFIQLYETL